MEEPQSELHRRAKKLINTLLFNGMDVTYQITPDYKIILLENMGPGKSERIYAHTKDIYDDERQEYVHYWEIVTIDVRSLYEREIGQRRGVGFRPMFTQSDSGLRFRGQ